MASRTSTNGVPQRLDRCAGWNVLGVRELSCRKCCNARCCERCVLWSAAHGTWSSGRNSSTSDDVASADDTAVSVSATLRTGRVTVPHATSTACCRAQRRRTMAVVTARDGTSTRSSSQWIQQRDILELKAV